jgi:hypothetical protein
MHAPANLPAAAGIPAEPRPHPNLMASYALCSLLLGPFFPAMLVPLYFRFRTLRYRFDGFERVRHFRDAGLGDPDDAPPPSAATAPALEAAREVLAAARALRAGSGAPR